MSKKPILILQMQRMGDLILSYPLILWLARRYPGHPIFVAAEELFYKPLMGLSPAVTYFPWTGADVLRQHEFELVLNLSIGSGRPCWRARSRPGRNSGRCSQRTVPVRARRLATLPHLAGE